MHLLFKVNNPRKEVGMRSGRSGVVEFGTGTEESSLRVKSGVFT
jgi:hypothetical protein